MKTAGSSCKTLAESVSQSFLTAQIKQIAQESNGKELGRNWEGTQEKSQELSDAWLTEFKFLQ